MYAGPAVKLFFTMVTELPCENMALELESGLIESAGAVTTTVGAGSNAAMRTGAQNANEVTVRNADAVMVRDLMLVFVCLLAWGQRGVVVLLWYVFLRASFQVYSSTRCKKHGDILCGVFHGLCSIMCVLSEWPYVHDNAHVATFLLACSILVFVAWSFLRDFSFNLLW